MQIADVTETRNVIPSLEFKTFMTIKSKCYFWNHQNYKWCSKRKKFPTYIAPISVRTCSFV